MAAAPALIAAAPALIAGGEAISWTALLRHAARAARSLGALEPGRPVVLEPRIALWDLAALLAAAARGAPVALIPPALPDAERARLRAAVPARVPDPVGALLFTSGSTGRRKGVLLDRAALAASAAATAAALPWREDDRWLACLPLAHVGGLMVLVRCLAARATAVLVDPSDRLDVAALARQIARDRVTRVSLVPTLLARLLALSPAWRPPPHLRAVLLGGAPPTGELLAAAAARGVPVRTTYGMTETCSHIAIDGRVQPGVEVALREGRLAVRGPVVMRGYAPPDHAPPAVDPDGWFVTGDRARIEPDGRLVLLGRADDVIVTGGAKVDPVRVEEVLRSVPGIAAACVFGVPDPEWGERVAAALVAGPAGPPAPALIARAAADRLARHERPRAIAYLAELPLGASGKLDRREAARRAAALLAPIA